MSVLTRFYFLRYITDYEERENMAVHVLAHLAIKNLKRWVWRREELETWLLGLDEAMQC
jgi:hypothetical protein